jgi:2-methylcitrate dehydratase PrpD
MTEYDPVFNELRNLTVWTSALRPSDVPDEIRTRTALIFWDDFAAMLAAQNEPELIALRAKIAESAGRAESTVFDGGDARVDRYSAALGNGSAADWCELDGGFRPVVCHAALYVLPALLAEAEATNASMDDVITSLLVGYESVARVAKAFTFPALRLHPHGGLATIGAAAGVAHLRGYDADLSARAISTAATMVLPGPFSHAVEGALVRNVWPGHCAQNGLRALDWTEIGISGTPSSLRNALCDIMGAEVAPERLSAGLGQDWAVTDGYHKMHACCQYAHSTVEAIMEALDGEVFTAEDIHEIRVETHEKGRKLDNPNPRTTLAAKFSIQHISAATLATGRADADAFHSSTLTDPGITALREKVLIAPYEPEMPPPNDRPAKVTIALADGTHLSGECLSARGGQDRPFSRAEIVTKGRINIAAAYPDAPERIAPVLEGRTNNLRWGTLVRSFT